MEHIFMYYCFRHNTDCFYFFVCVLKVVSQYFQQNLFNRQKFGTNNPFLFGISTPVIFNTHSLYANSLCQYNTAN